MLPIILGTLLPWSVVGVGCWVMHRMVRRQDDLLTRLESMDRQLNRVGAAVQRRQMKDSLARFVIEQQQSQAPPALPNGLTAGIAAPDFDLPDLAGQQRKLADFRGRKLLLVFFNPGCGYCVQMAPDLAALPIDDACTQPVPVVIASGPADAMRQLATEHNLRCPILLDAKGEIGTACKMTGTPTGYLIDEKGVIASPLTVGADALLAFVEDGEPEPAAGGHGEAKPKGKANRGLAASRLNRSGLKAGTPAPAFRLPKVGGGELALEELRGKRVLLVLSDPECGPCNAVAPALEQLHRSAPDVHVVIVSRRDEETNKKKVAELGLTFPVVLQQQWEISKLYGIFETPVGYLIDENGVIVHDVARGAEVIVGLLAVAPILQSAQAA